MWRWRGRKPLISQQPREADFQFRRMHVDVDHVGRHIDREERDRIAAYHEQPSKGLGQRVLQGAIADVPAIEEDILHAIIAVALAGMSHAARDPHFAVGRCWRRRSNAQPTRVRRAAMMRSAAFSVAGKSRTPAARQDVTVKWTRGKACCDPREGVADVAELGLWRAEKTSSARACCKKACGLLIAVLVGQRHVLRPSPKCPPATRFRLRPLARRRSVAEDESAGRSHRWRPGPRRESRAWRRGRGRRPRSACSWHARPPPAAGTSAAQAAARLSTTRIRSKPAVGASDIDPPRRAGINSVFHQFFDHARRPLDDLAGGDFVDQGLG